MPPNHVAIGDPGGTALLFVDPYNDFLSAEGKIWPNLAKVAQSVGLLANLKAVSEAVRRAGIQVVIVPHHRSTPGDYEGWDHPTPYQLAGKRLQKFGAGSWGGDWHPAFAPQEGDLVATEHWGSSGFSNTNLDTLLKQKAISRVILIGMVANTCIESTGKYASELGYHVTLVRDATAAVSAEAMRLAHDINGPTYAHAIVTSAEIITALEGQCWLANRRGLEQPSSFEA